MTGPANHRETICLLPSVTSAARVQNLTAHELLDKSNCDQFSEWLERSLEQLESRFESFVTSRTLMASIRS